ncbi:MAG: hypothetical protein JWM11_5476 [Planctomycetaceae bacterium]|nr:hypothetical protein [Planctomycetaceae bacterium]
MFRNGHLRRCIAVLLVLLTVTPQGWLRSCCCSRNQAQAADSQAAELDESRSDTNYSDTNYNGQFASEADLSPCCQKRLLAVRQAAAKSSASCCQLKQQRNHSEFETSERVSGLRDSHKCCCRSTIQTPRVERLVFRQVELKFLAALSTADSGIATRPTDLLARRWTDSISPGLNLRLDYAQLCRWVI